MATTYTTIQGDTYDIIARAQYGSELAAMEIAKANPAHLDVVVFSAGVVLAIPDVKESTGSDLMPPWRR